MILYSSLTQNGKLPLYVKQADSKFEKIENLLKRAKAIIGSKPGSTFEGVAGSGKFY